MSKASKRNRKQRKVGASVTLGLFDPPKVSAKLAAAARAADLAFFAKTKRDPESR